MRRKNGTGKINKTCEVCVKEFMARHDRPGKFCSLKCQRIGCVKRIKHFHHYKCKYCGIEVIRRKGHGGKREFCSIKCMSIIRGKNMRKDKHPRWKGGYSRTYASRKIIKEIIKKRGKCAECRTTKDLQGHHIHSYATNTKLRESEDNILVLCITCHSWKHPHLKSFILSKVQREL